MALTTSDTSSLSTSEVDGILNAVAKKRLINRQKKPTLLNSPRTPALNRARQMSRHRIKGVRGGYVGQVKTEREQDLQAYSGQDLLTFEDADTIFELNFGTSYVHMGGKLVHQQLEEAGVSVDYRQMSRTPRRADQLPLHAKEALHHLGMEKMEDLTNAFNQRLARAYWRSNASDSKLFTGWDGLFPVTGNSTGSIGGKSRSNPALRHVLSTGIAAADIENELDDMARDAGRFNQDGSGIDIWWVGEAFLDSLKSTFTGSSTVTPLAPLQRNTDVASKLDRIGLGIPDDAFYHRKSGAVLMHEPQFERLDDLDNPATPWSKRACGQNDTHLAFKIAKDAIPVVKPTPYNQQVTYVSIYGEYSMCTDKPNSQAVGAIS